MYILIYILIIAIGLILLSRKKQEKPFSGQKMGIPELVAKLYNEYIRNSPDWIELRRRSNFLVTNAAYLAKDQDPEMLQSAIRITLKDKNYIFYFTELPGVDTLIGSWYKHGALDLFLEGKRILLLKMAKDKRRKNAKWKPAYVEAYVEGDWIKDFQELEKQITSKDNSVQKENKTDNKEPRQ